MTDDIDLVLTKLLASPPGAPDARFVRRVELIVRAEEKLRIAEQKARTRFAVDGISAVAAILAFVLLARMTPSSSGGLLAVSSPAMLGAILLGLWAATTLPVSAPKLTPLDAGGQIGK